MMSASPSLVALAKSYEITRKRAPRSLADLPKSTPQAEAFAKQLKSQGYRFVGPTSVYAFMQNVGVVNDHVHGCFRRPPEACSSTRNAPEPGNHAETFAEIHTRDSRLCRVTGMHRVAGWSTDRSAALGSK